MGRNHRRVWGSLELSVLCRSCRRKTYSDASSSELGQRVLQLQELFLNSPDGSLQSKVALHHDRHGRKGDVGIFSQRKFGSQLIAFQLPLPRPECLLGTQTQSPYVFVVDEAFPLRANLMRPYPGSSGLDESKKIDNYSHSRTRRISEKGFGILAGIWRVLGRALELASEKAEAIVKACMALHNYLCTTDTTDTDNTVHPPHAC
uniref:DDE Tnp4 domain-containing protein n=1 Tax=Oncorhynchus kisutch TaxID=8019 RepID=A0A8C7JGK8_ONCKI